MKTTERNDKKIKQSLFSVKKYFFIFFLVSFVITCSILLFSSELNITVGDNKGSAISTFLNIFILSFIFTVFDGIYHKVVVERPLKQILSASQKIIKGDFTARISPLHGIQKRNEMDIIIDNFNEMAEELSGIETLRTDFIANVSHELKTPLSIIQNYADMMQLETTSDDEKKEYAKTISEASRNLSNLITNILRLNRLENQKIYLETKKCNLSDQLTTCLLQFENIWEDKNIDIKVEIDENIMIHADEELLSIVWSNLFSNAFKFTEIDGKVCVEAKQYNDCIIVSVCDNGCGMDSEVGKHIFEKFYQGDTSHSTKGNGLGLALVKRIVDIMKADISVESSLKKGTTFTVTLNERNQND